MQQSHPTTCLVTTDTDLFLLPEAIAEIKMWQSGNPTPLQMSNLGTGNSLTAPSSLDDRWLIIVGTDSAAIFTLPP